MGDFRFDLYWPRNRICHHFRNIWRVILWPWTRIVQGQRSWWQSEAHWWFPIWLPLSLTLHLLRYSIYLMQKLCDLDLGRIGVNLSRILGGRDAEPKRRRRREWDAEGVERGRVMGRGYPLPIRLGGLGERRELPQRVYPGAEFFYTQTPADTYFRLRFG